MIKCDYTDHLNVAEKIIHTRYCGQNFNEQISDDFLIEKNWVKITMVHYDTIKLVVLWKYDGHLTEYQKQYLKPYIEQDWNWLSRASKADLKEELY